MIFIFIFVRKQLNNIKIKCLRHTPRYSIRSSPIYPNFQMTTFKAKNVFLVFGMGHTRNKLTNEYKKMQNFKNLVDQQCKCVKLDTPRIGPILGFPLSKKSKSALFFFINLKILACEPQKIYFLASHARILRLENFQGYFLIFLMAPIFGDET